MTSELEQPHDDVKLHPDGPLGNVHDECHRGLPPAAARGHRDKGGVVLEHGANEAAVHGATF